MKPETEHPGKEFEKRFTIHEIRLMFFKKKTIVWTGSLLLFGLVVICVIGRGQDPSLPSFEKVKAAYKKSDALLLDRHGQVLHELRTDPQGRRLEWIKLEEVSPALIKAVLAVEDRRFYRHKGVDWIGMVSSVFNWSKDRRLRGASTLTMQLTALLDRKLKAQRTGRTLAMKWQQVKTARNLEKTWSKAQILEAYLNLSSFRGELQGIAAASRGLFDKAPNGLDQAESWTLAALLASPNAAVEQVVQRASSLSRFLSGSEFNDEIKSLAENRLRIPYTIKPVVALAPQAARMLLSGGETKIRTTIDGTLQRFVLETLDHYLAALEEGHAFDGAVLVLENRSGEILAYVGNSGRTASASWVDGIKAQRQAGSTLKPFLYGLAIEKGLLTAASIIEDSPLQIPTPTGLYVPQNYDSVFRGSVSLRTALSSSLNVPAVRTLLLVGLPPFFQRLRTLGLESLTQEADYYGYSLALGSADVSLLELTNAYRTLANHGWWSEMKIRREGRPSTPRKVMDNRTTFILSHILSDREARSLTFGLENPLATRFWTAAKTGTSKDMRDNWCLGYSDRYTVGVWVGNFSGEPMRQVSGVSGAAPVWLAIMNFLHSGRPSRPPLLPQGLVQTRVVFQEEVEPGRTEIFLQGTEPVVPIRPNSVYETPRIVAPQEETLIQIDPEIPEERQKVPFQYKPAGGRFQWILDQRETGIYDAFFLWKPETGPHILSIVDREKRVVDSVEFTVR
ncbi:MAG: penicillin-binding protein 1C [Thermodesulfobacteriota bacterium]